MQTIASLLLDANMNPTTFALVLAVAVKFVWFATLRVGAAR